MKKTMEGQFEVVKIDQIVKVEEFKNFYESQSDDSENQLKSSLEKEQLLPLITSRDFQLIDGYRRLKLLSALGREEVKVQFVDVEPSIDLRLSFNMYRVKTANDLTKEVYRFLNRLKNDKVKGIMVNLTIVTRLSEKKLTTDGNLPRQSASLIKLSKMTLRIICY